MDFAALAADIATEAELVLAHDRQIKALDKRIANHYDIADPQYIAFSAPGVSRVLAAQIVGRLGRSPAVHQPGGGALLLKTGAKAEQLRGG